MDVRFPRPLLSIYRLIVSNITSGCFISEQIRGVGCGLYGLKYLHHKSSQLPSFSPCRRNSQISRVTTRSKMAEQAMVSVQEKETFRLSDYDCIGFDLDNTICKYKLTQMVKLEYEVLAKYLVSEKGHNPEFLLQPLESHIDFLQKGLVFDFSRGNVLQLGIDGHIQKASHGTVFMTDSEIKDIYGPDKKWDVSVQFVNNMVEAWNGPMSERIRTVSDYFDMPAALAFGRIVDSLDAKEGNRLEIYNIWPDILDGLVYMYKRENFGLDDGGYFSELKANPRLYINKCSNNVINWLRQIKDTKVVFMLTGSHVDFATLTATNSLGENWKSLFDVVVCYARKPGFFTGARPFVKVEGFSELDPIDGGSLELGNIYSQGNWQDLYQLLARKTGKQHPKCLYVGDNLIQDVYVPSEYTKCDVVAVIEELGAEGMNSSTYVHKDSSIIVSNVWGSYFGYGDNQFERTSLWGGIIRKYSKICVPDLDVLAKLPLNHEFSIFSQKENDYSGYYPGLPISLSKPS